MKWTHDLIYSCKWTKQHLEKKPLDAFDLLDWDMHELRQCLKMKLLRSARYHADKITFIRHWLKTREFMDIPDFPK